MKILISACVMGSNVRWNGSNKLNHEVLEWADSVGAELVPVCPEASLFGTPRKPIRLRQEGDEVLAMMGKVNVAQQLEEKCQEIVSGHQDVVGFIGIARSPSCGISVGVKGRGSTMKAPMHRLARYPTTEINSLKTPENRAHFLARIEKYRKIHT